MDEKYLVVIFLCACFVLDCLLQPSDLTLAPNSTLFILQLHHFHLHLHLNFHASVHPSSNTRPCISLPESAEKEKFFLPIASVSRIMRIGVPPNWKISNDAKDAMQESASEFISFITCEASEKCKREKRKSINGDDVLWAMSVLGFEDYIDPLKLYLAKYRKMEAINSHSAQERTNS